MNYSDMLCLWCSKQVCFSQR